MVVTSAQRTASLPDVPTVAESGLAGQEAETLTAVLAPAGTPPAIIDQLYREIAALVAQPEVKAKLLALGFAPIANTPQEFAKSIDSDLKKWRKVISDAKIPQIQ
jgi:tripartite-type tricarboxylate transporter receptor subunit TctC